jgi:hypothetical protein
MTVLKANFYHALLTICLVLACFLVSGLLTQAWANGNPPPPPPLQTSTQYSTCRWISQGGPEPHLAASFFLSGGITLMTESPLTGILLTNLAGAYKEHLDHKRGGWCSGKDLLANLTGSILGAYTGNRLILWQNPRGTTMLSYSQSF